MWIARHSQIAFKANLKKGLLTANYEKNQFTNPFDLSISTTEKIIQSCLSIGSCTIDSHDPALCEGSKSQKTRKEDKGEGTKTMKTVKNNKEKMNDVVPDSKIREGRCCFYAMR